MNEIKTKILIKGIRIKIKNGGNLEEILTSYINLSEEEKNYIRQNI